jgi:Flp pilus assembly protein TadD
MAEGAERKLAALYFARRPDLAIAQLLEAVDMDPTYPGARFFLGYAYEQRRQFPEALAEFRTAAQLEDSIPAIHAALAGGYAAAGQPAEARTVLEELKQRADVPAYNFATIYAQLGDKEQAFEWLQKAYEERSLFMTWLGMDPELDSLRADPRFTALSKKVGLDK